MNISASRFSFLPSWHENCCFNLESLVQAMKRRLAANEYVNEIGDLLLDRVCMRVTLNYIQCIDVKQMYYNAMQCTVI